MEDGRVMPQIQYVVSLAVTEAIKDVCDRNILENGLVQHTNLEERRFLPFFNQFEKLYDLFIHQGFQSLEELYYKTWLHSGQRFIVQEKNDDQVVESVVTVQGLTSTRYLLAIGDDNQKCELHPDGNRKRFRGKSARGSPGTLCFDFFKGLVRRKLD